MDPDLSYIDSAMIVRFGVLAVLIAMSAFVSGSETAYFSLSPSDIDKVKKARSRASQTMLQLLSTQERLLATILIVNNLVNICIVLLSNKIIDEMVVFQSALSEFIIKVVIVTSILLLFGEILPKVFASYNSLKFARATSVPLYWLGIIFKPLSSVLMRSSSRINEALSRRRSNLSIGELSDAIEITQNQSDEERQMLTGIVEFANTDVEQIMRQRLDIVAIEINEGFEQVKKVIMSSGYSRIPIYEESIDNIQGILYVKDMLAYIDQKDDFQWSNRLRKAYFIPEHKKISDLLSEFQTNKVHMAIVVDEYGSTLGLVSLEDIMEEVVGEITDESDSEDTQHYTKIDEDTYIFEGKTHISELEEVLDMREGTFDDVRGEAESIAGLLLELKGDFLRQGEKLSSHGVKFRVQSMEARRIDKVKVERGNG